MPIILYIILQLIPDEFEQMRNKIICCLMLFFEEDSP